MSARTANDSRQETGVEMAIVGMALRFPGASTIEAFWDNLCDGVESVTRFGDVELIEAGLDPALLVRPNYVKAAAMLEGIDLFDAPFFNFTPAEAVALDPQQRLFMECGWEALENAGHAPGTFAGPIGVFAGVRISQYLGMLGMSSSSTSGLFHLIGNDKDYLATHLSYKLDLTGPSITVQSACSTSLAAVHLAAQSLLNGECDMALAGGASLLLPQRQGYLYEEGGVLSPDGHCRAFDRHGRGTIFGSGVGVVVLRRLQDAIADGDHVYAVLLGSAMNNDGSRKVGYVAPSVDGQARVIREALRIAEVHARDIAYVEAHGTGTALGDPIEVAALTRAFAIAPPCQKRCALGSVKTNFGHLDTAAGIAGFIKAVLAVRHGRIPPSLHFTAPNPEIDFENSPFYVNDRLRDWPDDGMPRRAGVSAFGIGGTNVHAIVQEPPPAVPARAGGDALSVRSSVILISARTPAALETATRNLAAHLARHSELALPDVAWTLRVGRRHFEHRRALVCRDRADAAAALRETPAVRVLEGTPSTESKSVAFLFPGYGGEYLGMVEHLYRQEAVFRQDVDHSAERLRPLLGRDVRPLLCSPRSVTVDGTPLQEMDIGLPALFIVEHALAQLWLSWGVKPDILLGHSLGEYAAACIAGVMSREDALALVALRGRLFEQLPPGAMLAIPLSEQDTRELLDGLPGRSVDLATINGPANCVVAGTPEAVAALDERLRLRGVHARPVRIRHAAHSWMIDPILPAFRDGVERIRLAPPRIPILSNVTGTRMSDADAVNPEYWVRHLRETVCFAPAAADLVQRPGHVYLEVGPGRVLTGLCLEQPGATPGLRHLTSLPGHHDKTSDAEHVRATLAKLHLAGVEIDWRAQSDGKPGRRLPLPTYPFERRRYWVSDASAPTAVRAADVAAAHGQPRHIDHWFSIPGWRRELSSSPRSRGTGPWLLFTDDGQDGEAAEALVRHLRESDRLVLTVRPGTAFQRINEVDFQIDPASRDDYARLWTELKQRDVPPRHIVYFRTLGLHETVGEPFDEGGYARMIDGSFFSLLFLAQAIGSAHTDGPIRLGIITDRLHAVTGDEALRPRQAPALGVCRVLRHEVPTLDCVNLDLALSGPGAIAPADLGTRIADELQRERCDEVVALRGRHRWVRGWQPLRLQEPTLPLTRLREGGVYLITGGLGDIGLELAAFLAKQASPRLILTGRAELPPRSSWEAWIAEHAEDDPVRRKLEKIQAMEADGADVWPCAVDVGDFDGMRALVAGIGDRYGVLHGIVHVAGVPGGGAVLTRTREAAEAVLSAKLRGTLILDALFPRGLDFFVLCSSIVSVLGGAGQIDYAAANAFLDQFAQARSASGSFTVSIGWDAWRDIGAAERAWRSAARDTGVAEASDVEASARTSGAQETVLADHPFFERHRPAGAGGRLFASRFRVDEEQWFLAEHRIRRAALLPGTMYLEMARAAFIIHRVDRPIELSQVVFMAPLVVREGETREVETRLVPQGNGFGFTIRSRPASGSHMFEEHAHGHVAELTATAERWDLKALWRQFTIEHPIAEPRRDPDEVDFGHHWDCVRSVRVRPGEAIAELELPRELSHETGRFGVHPALLDVATAAAALSNGGGDDALFLPFTYERIRVLAPLPARVISHVRRRQTTTDRARVYDGRIADEHGDTLLEFEGYMMVRAGEWNGAAGRERPPYAGIDESRRFALRPWQGVQAFARVLVQEQPHVLVCPQPLESRVAQHEAASRLLMGATEVGRDATDGVLHARPALANAYVAPLGEMETVLAELWRGFLGIDRVGVHDNFFELGGSSLRLVALQQELTKVFGIELSLRTILEHLTVAELSLAITRMKMDGDEASLLAQVERLSEEDAERLLRYTQGIRTRGAVDERPIRARLEAGDD